MINLLEETEIVLRRHAKSSSAIRYIVNAEGYMKIADFFTEAWKTTYDNRTGEMQIDPTLRIVGKNWWLERALVDGLEGWVFRRKPDRPTLRIETFSLHNNRGEKFKSKKDKVEETNVEFDPIDTKR